MYSIGKVVAQLVHRLFDFGMIVRGEGIAYRGLESAESMLGQARIEWTI
jgi:hypothetical protein